MMRYGLPTQDEINRWDDIQRAKGREMVRVVEPSPNSNECEACKGQTWEDGMLVCWVCGRTL